MNLRTVLVLATMASISVPSGTAAAQVYDAVAGFDGTNGSNPWSYLQRTDATTSLLTTPFSACDIGGGTNGFGTGDAFFIPAVYFNNTPDYAECLSVGLAANAGYFHPGANFSQAIVRFTAPDAGEYSIAASVVRHK